jgi:hypothetical protein
MLMMLSLRLSVWEPQFFLENYKETWIRGSWSPAAAAQGGHCWAMAPSNGRKLKCI